MYTWNTQAKELIEAAWGWLGEVGWEKKPKTFGFHVILPLILHFSEPNVIFK